MTKRYNDIPFLIVPGLGGSGAGHWQTYWEQTIPTAKRVLQLDWNLPNLSTWLGQLRIAVERTPDAVLVGHSLGCILIAHLARRYPDAPVAGALLVAPADVDYPEQLPVGLFDFAPTPLGRLPFPTTAVASTNDPYMSFARAQELADTWGAKLVNVQACGHINVAAGFGPWRAGEAILDELLDNVRRNRHGLEQQRLRKFARG
jgi:predicted alpha/beta hydrolase family esterase